MTRITIFGAGITGMAIASQLSKAYKVTIVARDLPGDAASDSWGSPWGCAGWVALGLGSPREQQMQLDALSYLCKLALSHPESSVRISELTDVHDVGATKVEELWCHGRLPIEGLKADQLPEGRNHSLTVRYSTFVLTPAVFLPWLRAHLEGTGVSFQRIETITSLADLSYLDHDVLVNASGLASQSLVDVKDEKVITDRTYTILVKSEYKNSFVRRYATEYTYIFGRGDGTVCIGGISEPVTNEIRSATDVRSHLLLRAHENLPEYFPSANLDEYEVLEDLTGIRPLRLPEARVDKEVIKGQNVVHAYGTTAGGYMYSFGLARVVADLVGEFVSETAQLFEPDAQFDRLNIDKQKGTPTWQVQGHLPASTSEFIYGLPTYGEHSTPRNLTALVTGATGVSGHSMVKVLAASPRWCKIYCMSSRPPPANFFTDLGEGASRVEHVQVNFLWEPSSIVTVLSKIQHIDQVFYFSYMQPPPTGNSMELFANADEMARVNKLMFSNFAEALKQTILRPKKFHLQTGAKHYAFYLGPAKIPAFESDPRTIIDDNFYYAQEDALYAYCDAVGAKWNVSRPNFIIGAVQDGTLNHLIGIGIYAAVQAYLGQPISFPGDYRAWDREQAQSTASLNAHFQEWLALTDSTANEAFNIHDGLNFTWGRLWPSLAKWYGAEWSSPETDESKYRVMKFPFEKTPRGYGPQASINSTFSLLEWSFQPEVEEAWQSLKEKHGLVLDPFTVEYRARVFSFSDMALIGDLLMVMSVRKARQHGFFATADSYHSIFNTLHELSRLKLIVPPTTNEFIEE